MMPVFCVQMAGLMKADARDGIAEAHLAHRQSIVQDNNLSGMELSLNENTLQAQLLFFLSSDDETRRFVDERLRETMSPYAPFLEDEDRVNISLVTATYVV